jgi:uncharacterized protein YjcR
MEFIANSSWSRDKINELAKKLNLKPNQVYKWNWDRNEAKVKKFLQSSIHKDVTARLLKEFMLPRPSKA